MSSPSTDALLGLTTMTSSGCLPCSLAEQQGIGQYAPNGNANPSPANGTLASTGTTAAPDPAPTTTRARWSGVIGVEGELTGDGRLIERNALRWENLPLPLRYVSADMGSHDGAVVVGWIDKITRASSGAIEAEGTFDPLSEYGPEATRQVGEELTNGVSMDLDDVSYEVRVAAELLEDEGLMGMPLFLAAEPNTMAVPPGDDAPDAAPPPSTDGVLPNGDACSCAEGQPGYDPDCDCSSDADADTDTGPEVDAEGRVTVMEMRSDDEVRVTTDGRLRAATIVAIPAFASAKIHLMAETTEAAPPPPPQLALVAAAAPKRPPAAWFTEPSFTGPTPLTVASDGRVFGHLAIWDTCHISHTSQGKCVTPPHSHTNYAYFHTGYVETAERTEVRVGHLTLDTLHAGPKLTPAGTVAHYENTGSCVADVAAGEDAWGIWVAGALRPSATQAQIRSLRSAPLSGDWRQIGSNLELVAALAVNVPGFPIPRPSGLVAGGQVRSLVASGMLPPKQVIRPGQPGALSTDDLRYLKRLADRERDADRLTASATAAALHTRVQAASLAMRARKPLPPTPLLRSDLVSTR